MKTLKAIIGVAIVVGGSYYGYLLIPPYFSNYQLQDYIESEARINTYTNKPEQDIREGVAKQARNLDIPLRPEDINVQRGAGEMQISCSYTVHVNLPGYPVDLKFAPTTKSRLITKQ
jgi:predicted membrane protein